ncbi:MAG: Enoyl-CoA-hydratase [Alphaproteobacteria bacterium MarineAlpha5_Bin5]|nr:MAG: Enoyl-CoA-hydratase [Alphaproteobacteria bacterium MarineAlpha5_Bin5]|tara:strand:- start:8267 stop:9052 length:786 start_codon:yes stop_codon:yes gene_type:complete
MSNIIKIEQKNNILKLILNDEKNYNTLSKKMINELNSNLIKASQNNYVRVIIIAAKGPIYSAGHNLKDINSHRLDRDKGKKYFQKLIENCSKLMINIIKNPKPIIAEVNGIATAAGCQLVASCDLAYSSQNGKFATPGVNIGLFCSTPMVAISRVIQKKQSMEMLLTGDLIDSKKALSIGLINDVYPENILSDKVNEMALKISKKPFKTLKIGKEAFYRQSEMNIEDAYKYTTSIMIQNMLDYDSIEGIESFIEKRKPHWK